MFPALVRLERYVSPLPRLFLGSLTSKKKAGGFGWMVRDSQGPLICIGYKSFDQNLKA